MFLFKNKGLILSNMASVEHLLDYFSVTKVHLTNCEACKDSLSGINRCRLQAFELNIFETIKIKMKEYLLSCLFLSASTLILAQQHFGQTKRCGSNEYHSALMQNPEYAEGWNDRQAQFRQYVLSNAQMQKADCDEVFYIPVAVHFQNTAIDAACAEQMAIDQVRIMNEDFGATNPDFTNWTDLKPTVWPAIEHGESCIQFCLATLNHPAGFGIEEGDYAITLNQTTGDDNAQWAGYLNFWVRDLGGGLLGFSPLGGTGNGDGVTCTTTAFSSVSCGGNVLNASFNLGRTITHEVGHYFNLLHPFDASGCADAVNDQVDDTPQTDNPTFGCPIGNPNFVNCTDPVLWPSFMDYCDDPCLFMFSEDQVIRMEAYFNSSPLLTISGNATTKCEDAACAGFRVDETKVDESCGGNDGQINFEVTGGVAPYLYSISNGASFQDGPDFNNLSEGKYYLLVRDSNGCERLDSIVLIREGVELSILDIESAFCGDNSGSVTVAVDYNDVFEYSITGIAGWRSDPVFSSLGPGTYTVTARNATDCTGSVVVTIPDETDLNLFIRNVKPVNCPLFDNGEIIAELTNGSPPFIFRLNGEQPQSQGTYSNLSAGNYSLNVIDDRGCQEYFDFTIGVSFLNVSSDCPCDVFVPNAFTPDADGLNDIFKSIASCPVSDFSMRIFDRWGGEIFSTNDPLQGWNGGIKGYYIQPGMYFYKILYRWGEETNESLEVQIKSGHVQLIR